jgi:hypothetical protein
MRFHEEIFYKFCWRSLSRILQQKSSFLQVFEMDCSGVAEHYSQVQVRCTGTALDQIPLLTKSQNSPDSKATFSPSFVTSNANRSCCERPDILEVRYRTLAFSSTLGLEHVPDCSLVYHIWRQFVFCCIG